MKYRVVDGSQGWEIASGLEAAEALRIREEYESKGGMNEGIIFDEDGNEFDADYELEIFVDSLMEYPGEELTEMTYEDATVNLEGYRACGMEIPEGLDEGMLCFLWNRALLISNPAPVEPDLPAPAEDGLSDEDLRVKADHPDWLCFPGVYHSDKATGACFFDLENLLADMKAYLHYDQEHIEIVRKAMMAYAGQH